jgi:cation diffusion facilitator family transporter
MDKTRAGYAEGIVSIVVNIALFAIKFWAGIVSNSIALIADAWHTLSDSISSVVVVIAVKLSSRKADKEHPFGHGRWEQIASIFIAFILGIIAFDFLKNSYYQFKNQESAQFGKVAIVVTAISILVKEALAQYAYYIARKTDNLSVKADGWHHRSDALSSVVVLAGIIFAKKLWWMDSALGAIIALMLFYAALMIVHEAITKLLGEDPSVDLVEKITNEAKAVYDSDMYLHHFHIHNYIHHHELTFHIRLDPKMSIKEGHKIASEIEKRIFNQYGIMATIHVEPLDRENVNDKICR